MSPSGEAPHGVAVPSHRCLYGLGLSILSLWSLWVLALHAFPGAMEFLREPTRGIVSRLVFWVLPTALYLVAERRGALADEQRPALTSILGINLPPPGSRLRALITTIVVTLLLLAGTATQTQRTLLEVIVLLVQHAELRFVAPLFEELLFRGIFLGELLRSIRNAQGGALRLRRRYWTAQLGVALFFLLIHWPYWLSSYGFTSTVARSLPVFVTGLVLGVTFAQGRSIWPAVFVHYLNNELSHL